MKSFNATKKDVTGARALDKRKFVCDSRLNHVRADHVSS